MTQNCSLKLTSKLITNESKEYEAAIDVMERISILVARYSKVEAMDLGLEELTYFQGALTALYVKVLEFQANVVCYFAKNTPERNLSGIFLVDDWQNFQLEIESRDAECVKHRQSLNSSDRKSMILDVEDLVQKMLDGLDQQYRENNDALLWVCDVQFEKDHDNVRDALGDLHQDAGNWLLRELDVWNHDDPPTSLWICGTGK